MRKSILCYLCIFYAIGGYSFAGGLESNLDSINTLVKTNELAKAKSYINSLKEAYDGKKNYLWHTKSNLLLGEIHRNEGEFGKAIIYNLEAIRFSRKANYAELTKDLASLYNRCGIIFKNFNSYDLAEEYFFKGLEHSRILQNQELHLILNYNLAGLYRETKDYNKAIQILTASLEKLQIGSKDYFDFNNRLALTYRKSGQFENAIKIHLDLIDRLSTDNLSKRASYHHNLAKSYKAAKDYDNALIHYTKAIDYKRQISSRRSLFSSYFGIAETHYQLSEYHLSADFFKKAEELLPLQRLHPDYFEIYKACANLNYKLRYYEKSKYYEDLYSDKMNEYLEIQADIQETDQRYNMDLITKRYFAEVDKQERIADILMYSKLTSGGLLTLLLLVIAYHRYQKILLRRNIERELIALKIID